VICEQTMAKLDVIINAYPALLLQCECGQGFAINLFKTDKNVELTRTPEGYRVVNAKCPKCAETSS